MHIAVKMGKESLIKYILDEYFIKSKVLDINATNFYGKTALDVSDEMNSKVIRNYLKEHKSKD